MYLKLSFIISILITGLVGCAGDKSGSGQKYIVVFKRQNASVMQASAQLEERHSLDQPEKIFSRVIRAGVYELTEDQAADLADDADILYIEKDQRVQVGSSQSMPTWGLDRIDQVNLPLDQAYSYQGGPNVVNAYVIDTGILVTHEDFGGRALSGIDLVDDDADATDCNGHGTHVAGTIGSATYGVAKSAKLHAVRVLDCFGSGSFSDVIAGIEWVAANHVKPAVANMSLGGGASQAVDDAVSAAVAAGVTFVVAAGNENRNACNGSPSRVPVAITVGATSSTDARSTFSNFGSCVDIFAPGTDIKSTWSTGATATQTISGTSMAAPHVAGAIALYLSQHPDDTPAQVSSALIAGAISGKVTAPGADSPNLLLNTAFAQGEGGGDDEGGDEPGQQPEDGLKNGIAVGGLQAAKNEELFFTINVPAGSQSLTVEISGSSGDADLYVRAGQKPTTGSYGCRPYKSGSTETCVISSPVPGVYHVMIRGYTAYANVTLKATIAVGNANGAPCSGCDKLSGSLAGQGAFEYRPDERAVAAGTQQYFLIGPAAADFDLYLYKKNGSQWLEVAKAVKASSSESIAYNGAAGVYRLKVLSYRGSGAYDIYHKKP